MATLTPTEILSQTLEAFKKSTPLISKFSTDLSDERAMKDQVIQAHIRQLPTVGDYGADGYFSNATNANSLFLDVPLTLDQHKHVTINLTHLNALSDEKKNTSIGDSAFVLGKAVVDSALAKITAANFTNSEIVTTANTDKSTLNAARKNLVTQGANTSNLYGLINSDFSEALLEDTRITSKDFNGQEPTDDALNVLTGVSGFKEIREYADFPANAESLEAFFFDPRAICLATRLPNDSTQLAASMGIPSVASTVEVTDPESGLSMLGIMHMQPGTLDMYLTVTVIWGTTVGGTNLDDSGYRITSA
tara:strand:- start:363 stop:1280 length:918 start_codon:yes stop_codon:yes gene_type:complete